MHNGSGEVPHAQRIKAAAQPPVAPMTAAFDFVIQEILSGAARDAVVLLASTPQKHYR